MTTLLALIAAVGCGSASGPVAYDVRASGVDLELVRAQAEWGLAYWDVPGSVLDGWTVRLTEEAVDCGTCMRGAGCTDYASRTISVIWQPYCGAAPLPHEIGHVAFPGVPHSDPRFAAVDEATWDAWCGR